MRQYISVPLQKGDEIQVVNLKAEETLSNEELQEKAKQKLRRLNYKRYCEVVENPLPPLKNLYTDLCPVPCPNCGYLIICPPVKVSTFRLVDGDCAWCEQEVTFAITESVVKPWIREGSDRKESVIINEDETAAALGVAGVTPVCQKTINGVIVLRVGVAIMGSMNFPQLEGCNPFDTNFCDNYIEAKGNTLEEARKNLIKEFDSMSRSML